MGCVDCKDRLEEIEQVAFGGSFPFSELVSGRANAPPSRSAFVGCFRQVHVFGRLVRIVDYWHADLNTYVETIGGCD